MYKLLLVDDDPLICEGMKHIINWSNYGIDVQYTAQNGMEALNILHQFEVDIMITDIHMPDISGVELITEALRYQPELKCLVLSGYDDYKYVRSAMRAGALDYHLKPVSKEELEENIVALLAPLEEKKNFPRHSSNQLLLERTMQRFLNNSITPKERLEKLEFFQLNTNPAAVILGLVYCKEQPDTVNHCLKAFLSLPVETIPFYLSKDVLCIICTSSQRIEDVKRIRSSFQQCLDYLRVQTGNPAYAVLSDIGTGWRQIPALYQHACFLLDYLELRGKRPEQVYCGNAQIIEYSINVAEIRLLLQSETSLSFYRFLEKVFSENGIVERDTCSDCLALSVLRSFLSVASDQLVPDEVLLQIRRQMMKNIVSSMTLQSLKRNLYPLASDLAAAISSVQKKEYSTFIKKTLEIITKEYSDCTLSLKTIADRLFVNATYLGKQFKSETGIFFNDYLSKIRVQRAETLLVTTELKLVDIAQQIGFSSENYFISVFKKHTSVTPGSIRRIIDSYEYEE